MGMNDLDCNKSFDIGDAKIVAIVQARYKSTRLPGKSLLDIGGISALGSTIKRLQKCKNLNGIIVATSTETEDTLVVQEAIKYGVQYFTGSHEDVLARYYHCAKFYGITRIVRITADCPFLMPDLVDELIARSKGFDYGSNVRKRTYPKGFDCEIFDFSELERAYNMATEAYDREHVTPYIIKAACSKFSLQDYDDNYGDKRITLDTAQDYQDLVAYHKVIGNIYNYPDCKKVMDKLISTEEYCTNLELGRI